MSPLAVQARLRRWRRHVAVLALVLFLGGVVAVHHGPVGMRAMPGHTVCLFVLVVGAAVAAAIRVLPRRPWSRPAAVIALGSLIVEHPRAAPARAGPRFLDLRVLRL